jgi:hypothetical protein
MTEDQRRDRDVRSWIVAEGAVRAPDRLRDALRAEVAQTRQERAPGTVPQWLATMPMRAAAVILAVVLGAGTLGLLAGRSSVGVPPSAATPTPVPTASPSVSPSGEAPTPDPPAGQALPAGVLTPAHLHPNLQATVPSGWILSRDGGDLLVLVPPDPGAYRQPNGQTFYNSVNVYARPRAGQPDGTMTPVDGVGTTAKDLATWLSKRPQLTATTPAADTIAGRPAWRLDFHLSPNAGDLCNIKCANLLNATDNPDDYAMGIIGDWQVRAWLLDGPDGSPLMVTIEAPSGQGFDALLAEATPVVGSLRFVTH